MKAHLAHEARKLNATTKSKDISGYLPPALANTPELEYSNDEIDTESSLELSDVPTKIIEPDPYPAPIEQDIHFPRYVEGPLYDRHEEFVEGAKDIQEKWNAHLISATVNDNLYQKVLQESTANLKWYNVRNILIKIEGLSDSGEGCKTFCLYVSESTIDIPGPTGTNLQEVILRIAHPILVHLGANKCFTFASNHFWWPQMQADFKRYVDSYQSC